MKAVQLRKLYPGLWAEMETGVWDDQKMFYPSPTPTMIKEMKRVAYNAAFNACYIVHNKLKG